MTNSVQENAGTPPGFLRAAMLAALLAPAAASAQPGIQQQADAWRYGLSVYGYFPSLSGTASAPTSPGGPTIDVSADKLIDALKFTFMASFDANNGRYGLFTDLLYLDLGESKQGTRDFTIDHKAISGSTSANLDWDLKGTLWTLAGYYRVPTDDRFTLDLLGGARMFRLRPKLGWSIQGDLDGIAATSRTGEVSQSETLWDAVVGAKGRVALDGSRRWSLPYYVDVGTGQSRLTWQAALGVSYAFSWGELTGMWRYISYDLKSDSMIDDLSFNGPMVGATFRW
ncbi:hypothetical protein [Variovorax soli]|uniref:hypothetical protein n=1 Tax=Variovorax soli TaxID=376815 RepID=UPI000A8633B8|nr:hypothetical protein [Variovorax soli]